MPSLAPGGEAAIGWTYSPSAFRVRALGAVSYYPTQTKFAPTTTTMGGAGTGGSERGDFWVVAGGVRGCLGRVLGAFDVGPCVGGLVGATRASGAGDGGPSVSFATQHGFAYWGAVEVGALATWNVAPAFALFARGDALVSPDPPTYVVNNPAGQATVYTVPFVAGRAVVGLEARFF
jgi:hypothetical protein